MPRKHESKNVPASKKAKPSNRSSAPEVVEIEESETIPGFDQNLLRCPLCSQFPRNEVYQCDTGHSVCADCLTKLRVRKCPTCQATFKKTRNYLAEGLLDSMKFPCSWKEKGCPAIQMARRDLTSHEVQCDFNPNSVKFCYMFAKSCCEHKFCPVSAKDPGQMKIFLDHMKIAHPDFTVRDVKVRESFFIHFKYSWSNIFLGLGTCGHHEPFLFKTILRLHPTQTNQDQRRQQYYVILCRFAAINGYTAFLFKCVRLTDDSQNRMSITFTLTSQKTDKPQVPELNWTEEPQGIRQLKDFWVGRQDDDFSSYHMIPLSFTLDNYKTEEGIEVECIFN